MISFEKNGDVARQLAGANFKNGLAQAISLLKSQSGFPADQKARADSRLRHRKQAYQNGPALAMVNSDKGITNLHVPSDVIVDASMPAMIREGGPGCGTPKARQQDTQGRHPRIPQLRRCLSGGHRLLQSQRRARSQATMGSVPNVGLMAQKPPRNTARHNKTFEIPAAGTVRVVEAMSGNILLSASRRGPKRRHLARCARPRTRQSATG